MAFLLKHGFDLFRIWSSSLLVVDLSKGIVALLSSFILGWKTLTPATQKIFFKKKEHIGWWDIVKALSLTIPLSWILISFVQIPVEPVESWVTFSSAASQGGTSQSVAQPTITIIAPTITPTPTPSPTPNPSPTPAPSPTPGYTPSFTLTPTCLAENKPGGTEVGLFSSVTTEKNTYELVFGSEYFEIDGNILRTKRKFDYESKSDYPITVQTINQNGQNILTKTFHICIEDINEPPTLSVAPSSSLSTEIGTPVSAKITATDPEKNQIQFTLSGDTKGALIDPDTGHFTWTPQQPGSYPFTIRATEQDAAENLSGTARITVNVGTPPLPHPCIHDASSPFYIASPASGASFNSNNVVVILYIKGSATKSKNYGKFDILYTKYIDDKNGDDGRALSPNKWYPLVSKKPINTSDPYISMDNNNVRIEIPKKMPSGNYWISAQLYYHDGGDFSDPRYTQNCAVKVHIGN